MRQTNDPSSRQSEGVWYATVGGPIFALHFYCTRGVADPAAGVSETKACSGQGVQCKSTVTIIRRVVGNTEGDNKTITRNAIQGRDEGSKLVDEEMNRATISNRFGHSKAGSGSLRAFGAEEYTSASSTSRSCMPIPIASHCAALHITAGQALCSFGVCSTTTANSSRPQYVSETKLDALPV
jgi:hypothetical protein